MAAAVSYLVSRRFPKPTLRSSFSRSVFGRHLDFEMAAAVGSPSRRAHLSATLFGSCRSLCPSTIEMAAVGCSSRRASECDSHRHLPIALSFDHRDGRRRQLPCLSSVPQADASIELQSICLWPSSRLRDGRRRRFAKPTLRSVAPSTERFHHRHHPTNHHYGDQVRPSGLSQRFAIAMPLRRERDPGLLAARLPAIFSSVDFQSTIRLSSCPTARLDGRRPSRAADRHRVEREWFEHRAAARLSVAPSGTSDRHSAMSRIALFRLGFRLRGVQP